MKRFTEWFIQEIADIGLYIAVFGLICVLVVALYNWPILWWAVICIGIMIAANA